MNKKLRFLMPLVVILALLAAPIFSTQGVAAAENDVHFYLTILHNNDGESQVINAGSGLEDFGGAARFKTVVDNLKWEAIHSPWTQGGAKRGVVMISSGDNFLAGPEFNAGLEKGVPFYDTIAMELIGYDASIFPGSARTQTVLSTAPFRETNPGTRHARKPDCLCPAIDARPVCPPFHTG